MYFLEYCDVKIFFVGSVELFSIFKNVCIIGIMNIVDCFIVLVDYVFCCCFVFIIFFFKYEILF